MTYAIEAISVLFIVTGAFFFFAGTVGLLRFPDTISRMHALTKADNLGLGFTIVGLLLRVTTVSGAAHLVLIWLLVLVSTSTACYLVANRVVAAQEEGEGES